jgi:hypothetical protein
MSETKVVEKIKTQILFEVSDTVHLFSMDERKPT